MPVARAGGCGERWSMPGCVDPEMRRGGAVDPTTSSAARSTESMAMHVDERHAAIEQVAVELGC